MAHHRLRDWANLMPEILSLVARRLNPLDYANFSAVCASWASIATPANGMPPPLPLRNPRPLLLLLPGEGGDRSESCCTLLDSLDAGRRYDMGPLPEMDGKRVVAGSQFGWLAILHTHSSHLFLFNPFTAARIDLPPIITADVDDPLWVPSQPCKVVLSSNPSRGGHFMAVALFGYRDLALFRTGEDAWSFLYDLHLRFRVADIICWRGEAVAVSKDGKMYDIQLSDAPGTTVVPRLIVTEPIPSFSPSRPLSPSQYPVDSSSFCRDLSASARFSILESLSWKKLSPCRHPRTCRGLQRKSKSYRIPLPTTQYLVESTSGALLHVFRDFHGGIKVHMLGKESGRWTPVTRFPGTALFVSATCSMSMSVSSETSIKENCVFLADRNKVFDISRGSTVPWPPHLPRLRGTGDVWITSPYLEPKTSGSRRRYRSLQAFRGYKR